MEGLFSLLLFAVAFFFVMRFGCGVGIHKKGEHGGLHNHGDHNKDQLKHLDPVCGMEVDVDQGYGKMHGGNLFRFCSRDCLDKFEADTEQYLKNKNHDKRHHG